jgi:hypothetical protein
LTVRTPPRPVPIPSAGFWGLLERLCLSSSADPEGLRSRDNDGS